MLICQSISVTVQLSFCLSVYLPIYIYISIYVAAELLLSVLRVAVLPLLQEQQQQQTTAYKAYIGTSPSLYGDIT